MVIVKKLTLFDVVNLVVGAIIGADIYIAASFGSGLLGPASLLAWVVAGIFATIIALTFAKCSSVVRRAGGPYAYAKKAFGHFPGFITGWSLWLAEVAALCVFPIAFATYISFFLPLDFIGKAIVILAFNMFLFMTNYFGIKKAARTNDILTILKLAPLFLLIVVGLGWIFSNPSEAIKNFTPFFPLGMDGFGKAIVLIFWAYVGFELATIPSSEIKDSEKVVPKAIVIGMAIVGVFYILTNTVIVGSANYADIAKQGAPLTYISLILMGSMGALIMTIGAIFSVSGSDESGLIGSVRLAYAMSADGYFPEHLARLNKKYSTPHISLFIHTSIAFFASVFLPVKDIITFSVFGLAFSYIMVALSAIKIREDMETKILGVLSIVVCFYLISQTGILNIGIGIVLLFAGIPIYTFFSPKSELLEAKRNLFKRENILKHRLEKESIFLAHIIKHAKIVHRKMRNGRKD